MTLYVQKNGDQIQFFHFHFLANSRLKLVPKIVAVREDRMPGGRNSGAVYNLYKVSGVALFTNQTRSCLMLSPFVRR